MGSFTSRQNAGVEEVDISSNHAYKYPPRSGNYFGSHFIMGGERFDTPQPEAYLFGENADLNFLGSKPTPFPYPPPQANEPTKTLKSLVNIRKESLRFVRVPSDPSTKVSPVENKTALEPKVVEPDDADVGINIEFMFDCDCRCAITIHYLCQEEVTPAGVVYISSNPVLSSETYHYKKGVGQSFFQPSHKCYPGAFTEEQLTYNMEREIIPVAIHCVAEEPADEPRQSHTTIAVIDKHSDGSYGLRALKQKLFVDGLSYLLQEIYGIENKNSENNKGSVDTETEDNGSECVICMCDGRDTLILPCRHLCLCNSCADSLRYQANNCPICRAPFRALLQIRALQKSTSATIPTPAPAEGPFGAIPAGYEAISLIEALNGPNQTPRCITTPLAPAVGTPDTEAATAIQAAEALNRSTLDSKGPPRPGELRDKGGSPSSEDLNMAPEFRMSVLLARDNDNSSTSKEDGKTSPLLPTSKRPSKREKASRLRDTVLVVDETLENGDQSEAEADSEAEKMSPLLDSSKSTDPIMVGNTRADKATSPPSSPPHPASLVAQSPVPTAADDSDYYTPDDQGPGILLDTDKLETRSTAAPSMSAGNTPVRAPGTPLSAATSHRSSGDSFSSSSSTRQLLPPVTITSGSPASNQVPDSGGSLQDVAMV